MKLLIAIPALNEEESIAAIIERCLDARATIIANSPVTEVEITVVSDGSTDRTVELASQYLDWIHLIVFEKNRGYGAAIMEAWRQSDADLLSFLDADGTCDPRFFARFCTELVERDADIVLGCRLNAQSHMPLTRRVGNTMFAWLLSGFSQSRVRDTASGMRVVRKSCLKKLYPLPNGLHFTPAMSARACMSRDLKCVEVDMPYHERVGESKLSPLKDGIRFLRVILKAALLYRPSRLLGAAAALMVAIACMMLLYPAYFYCLHGRLQEWMIYRFLVAEQLSTMATLIWCVTYLGDKAVAISLSEDPVKNKSPGPLGWLYGRGWFPIVPVVVAAIGGVMVLDASGQFLSTGQVFQHWSRFVAMMFFLTVATALLVTWMVSCCLDLLAERLSYLKDASESESQEPVEPLKIRAAA
jgi:glycosyltransferase involved in cell wall biosynthesis